MLFLTLDVISQLLFMLIPSLFSVNTTDVALIFRISFYSYSPILVVLVAYMIAVGFFQPEYLRYAPSILIEYVLSQLVPI